MIDPLTDMIKTLEALALLAQAKSPDKFRQVGCAGHLGFNRYVSGFNTILRPDKIDIKGFWEDRLIRRPYMIHAEQMMFKHAYDRVSIVVTTLFPCAPCMNLMALMGVQVLFYDSMLKRDKIALDIAKHNRIECHEHKFIPV